MSAGTPWSDDELTLLWRYDLGSAEIARKTGRSVDSVAQKRRKLRGWSEQVKAQKSAYGRRRQRERNDESVARAHRSGQPWTPAEVQVAVDRALTCEEAAEQLGRTVFAVKYQRKEHQRRTGR